MSHLVYQSLQRSSEWIQKIEKEIHKWPTDKVSKTKIPSRQKGRLEAFIRCLHSSGLGNSVLRIEQSQTGTLPRLLTYTLQVLAACQRGGDFEHRLVSDQAESDVEQLIEYSREDSMDTLLSCFIHPDSYQVKEWLTMECSQCGFLARQLQINHVIRQLPYSLSLQESLMARFSNSNAKKFTCQRPNCSSKNATLSHLIEKRPILLFIQWSFDMIVTPCFLFETEYLAIGFICHDYEKDQWSFSTQCMNAKVVVLKRV